MTPEQINRIPTGLPVYDVNGEHIGSVTTNNSTDALTGKYLMVAKQGSNYYWRIPTAYVIHADNRRVGLSISARVIRAHGDWLFMYSGT